MNYQTKSAEKICLSLSNLIRGTTSSNTTTIKTI